MNRWLILLIGLLRLSWLLPGIGVLTWTTARPSVPPPVNRSSSAIDIPRGSTISLVDDTEPNSISLVAAADQDDVAETLVSLDARAVAVAEVTSQDPKRKAETRCAYQRLPSQRFC